MTFNPINVQHLFRICTIDKDDNEQRRLGHRRSIVAVSCSAYTERGTRASQIEIIRVYSPSQTSIHLSLHHHRSAALGQRDYTSVRTHHRAEHLSRQAAAAAHASYYAHPSLHLHTYLPRRSLSGNVLPDALQDGKVLEAMNGPAPSAINGDPDDKVPEGEGTKGTREEEGGKENAGKPSGMDQGALEHNGEAGGTHTSPGPTAQEVQRFKETQSSWTNHVEAGVGSTRPGLTRHWSAVQGMEPHLQLMCGPLISYYTTIKDVWQGGAMVVTADEGSIYEPAPSLYLNFHPYSSPSEIKPTLHDSSQTLLEPVTLRATKFHSFSGHNGSFSFWRFIIEIPLQSVEMTVKYTLNGGAELNFVLPHIGQNLHWAAHSCNGFSTGVNPDEFKGDYHSGYDPVWEDLLLKHHERAFHCMVGGGDQIYCDALIREPELQPWINEPDRKSKLAHPLTDEIKAAVDRFYFNHYCKIFRSNAFGRANSSIPMVNMLDDHDLIDGFGTYDDETQAAPVMSYVGSRGYFWFLIFQLFVNDEVDGTNPTPGTHPIKSMIIGEPGAWIPFPSHSLLVYLGPKVVMLALDCRAERKQKQICTMDTYNKTFNELKKYAGVEQVVILLGVPIAYPRMSFLEHFLDLKYNPINVLARHNALGLGGMVNKFNQASELLDDLNDHWCANYHKKERNWLVLETQNLALEMGARITFLSGDVHLAAVGCLFSKHAGRKKLEPAKDHRYMLNVITSAIVNTPPPPGAAKMVSILGGHKHRTLPKGTDEKMIPLFDKDTDGSVMKRKLCQPRRNYASVDYLESGELQFDFKVEKSRGAGETVSYPIKAPAPRWDVNTP
ncbi:putative plasma membrane protein [Kockovaella imperatae]|uniref:Putative plasma membrane protein n=1 Tax=Kockovaella imperatae TaxID=4999 RepID=A0A1Y1UKL8_9TREE|nr:putative plasma membrane protein [Kockovaella imperatae]ORX38016.1 putative plasma membrane protein [Kockovaella imperatae]